MNTMEILNAAESTGVKFWHENGFLQFTGPRDALSTFLAQMRTHKAELLALISEQAERTPLSTVQNGREQDIRASAVAGKGRQSRAWKAGQGMTRNSP